MQARNFIASTLVAAGMMLAGCGGVEPETGEPVDLATSEDALPDCTGQDYAYTYYSDPGKTNMVGERGCSCGYWFQWGTRTSNYDFYSGTCF
ncbi:hypothetical protein ACLESO_16025 [Pyxidicoccus sp. 3LG]